MEKMAIAEKVRQISPKLPARSASENINSSFECISGVSKCSVNVVFV